VDKEARDVVVVDGLRGRNSNRKIADKTWAAALAILRRPEWHDFGPTLAAEELDKRHRIEVGERNAGRMDDRGRIVPAAFAIHGGLTGAPAVGEVGPVDLKIF
jgi:hypothetical protein